MFKKGDNVAQIVAPPVTGQVQGFSVDQETGAVQILVGWTDGDGNAHARYFNDGEIEAAQQPDVQS
jgi:hypothetical protein